MLLKVVTLCSGYDSQCLALNRLKQNFSDFDYELIAWSEFDPESKSPLERQPAVIAHNALFPQWEDRNLGDMTKIDWSKVPDFDLLTYSTPCQSISNAGLQHGFAEGSGTRSSIIWNVRDAVKIKRPKYLLLENVKAMVEGKFLSMFNLWQRELENLGYVNFAQVLNAKDYGVPQNRERIFLFSIREDGENPQYNFPQPFKLPISLKDVLEQNVDEKYYLSNKLIASISRDNGGYKAMKPSEEPHEGTASCLTARMWKMELKEIFGLSRSRDKKGNVVKRNLNDYVNCIHTQVGTARENMEVYVIEIYEPTIVAMRGRNPNNPSEREKSNGKYKQSLEMNNNNTSNSLTSVPKDNLVVEPIEPTFRIRKLTPREAFRLMGVDDKDIDTIQASGNRNSAQYKLAGNSIVVDVIYHIFRKAFIETNNEQQQLTLF